MTQLLLYLSTFNISPTDTFSTLFHSPSTMLLHALFSLLLLELISCITAAIDREDVVSAKAKDFFKLTKNMKRNEVSVYHRIGHACNPSLLEGCQKEDIIKQPPVLFAHDQTDIPIPGMILHVHQNEDALDIQEDFGIERRSRGDINLYHKPCCKIYTNTQSMDATLQNDHKHYELVEVLHNDLGSVNMYSHDFAYRPVVALPSSAHGRWRDDEYWWDNNIHKGAEYEKIGPRAFAGGAHGEVWRAKRRCYLPVVAVDISRAPDSNDFRTPDDETMKCNEGEGLIMKRLKVGKSYSLMEAGLREIYFGVKNNDPEMFTSYIDHFFRRKPGDSIDDLELWIVFKDAGPSLRSYLYTAIDSGDFVVYQHSSFWTQLRTETKKESVTSLVALISTPDVCSANKTDGRDDTTSQNKNDDNGDEDEHPKVHGKDVLRSILRQLLTSAAKLHQNGVLHRDIKPSNIMCESDGRLYPTKCVLGDFSSAYDEYSSQHLYSQGPSKAEQTDEYAPPEVLFNTSKWIPFDEIKPESYDSWSIGVVILEMLLGTPLVFSVDKRTTALLTKKMKDEGADDSDIRRALYLAALSQFCIYIPSASSDKDWPLREGDPLFQASMARETCTITDFHGALRARDPLGIGFSTDMNPLLRLIWELLAWNPEERLTAADALQHYYFTGAAVKNDKEMTALETQALDPRLDVNLNEKTPQSFFCPKCGRVFDNLQSCQTHTRARKHSHFCEYERSLLPKCLNAHSMLPAHPTSGYCDIQGRRRTIEDYHHVHLHETHQFYGVFDGHNSNFASKYASAELYKRLVSPLSDVDNDIKEGRDWKREVQHEMTEAFRQLHEGYLEAMKRIPISSMRKAGTTATALFVTEKAVIISSVGDSRAVLSLGASFQSTQNTIDALPLTVDHVASNKLERQRVESLGGFVEERGGTLRVNGTLVLTRSIGDAHLADFLSRIPHVISFTRDEVNMKCQPGVTGGSNEEIMPCFIILASDGLWDVMTNQEAVTLVTITVRKYQANWRDEGAFQEAAEILTQEAWVRGSTDNIGVCVVAIT